MGLTWDISGMICVKLGLICSTWFNMGLIWDSYIESGIDLGFIYVEYRLRWFKTA